MISGYMVQYRAISILSEMGYPVSIPCNPHSPYDLVVDTGKSLKRVQVKSCNTQTRLRYRVDIACGAQSNKRPYRSNAFDFFVIHIPMWDAWYVVPLSDVLGTHWFTVHPDTGKGAHEKYRNAWNLLLK